MSFLICLLAVLLVVRAAGPGIRRRAGVLYGISAVLAVAMTAVAALDLASALPMVLDRLLWRPLANGTLATALWAAVMYAGAVPDGSPLQRQVMPIRGELSIVASILTLGHNAVTGQTYFVRLFTDGGSLSMGEKLATVCSLVMLVVMLPLFVTSFPSVRRRMEAKRWKKLQRWAYLFYGLIYVHVLLLLVPIARGGKGAVLFNILVFTVVFLGYAALRLSKALARQGKSQVLPRAAAGGAALLVLLSCQPVGVEDSPWPEAAPAASAAPDRQGAAIPTPEPGAERQYQDGVYTAKGKGYAGPVWVEVTIESDIITGIVITEQVEDEPYWTRALVTVDRILEEQTVDVENVAGATKSVKGIKKAVKNALKQARI